MTTRPARILFACVHNAGRSQMAAALFNRQADPAKATAVSAGTNPGHQVHPVVAEALGELGIDTSGIQPQKLTAELAEGAAWLITMGCGDDCPVVPGARRDDWPLPDPKDRPIEEVRVIRENVAGRVERFIRENDWQRE